MDRAVLQAGRKPIGLIGEDRPCGCAGRGGVVGQGWLAQLEHAVLQSVGARCSMASGRARRVRVRMVITGAPVGSAACSVKVSGPVDVSWTWSRVAAVACRVIPVNANGSRGAGSASGAVRENAAARGAKRRRGERGGCRIR